MSTAAERISFGRCAETCPAVDRAFEDFIEDLRPLIAPSVLADVKDAAEKCCDTVKEYGTFRLRTALTEACEELEAGDELNTSLESQVEQLRAKLADQAERIAELEAATA